MKDRVEYKAYTYCRRSEMRERQTETDRTDREARNDREGAIQSRKKEDTLREGGGEEEG